MSGRIKTMLENLKPPVQKRTCKVRTILETLEPADQEILEAAIMDSAKWKIKTLSDELRNNGIELSERPISNHRTKACSCWKI